MKIICQVHSGNQKHTKQEKVKYREEESQIINSKLSCIGTQPCFSTVLSFVWAIKQGFE